MASYQTAQKKQLVDFLTRYCETAFTAEELAERMKEESGGAGTPGKSTVYRLIRKMVEDGTVKRLVKGNSRKFVYQIAAGEHCATHLHMKCVKCGRLLHMDDEQSRCILLQVLAENKFCIDEKQTVLLGNCGDCEKTEGRKETL